MLERLVSLAPSAAGYSNLGYARRMIGQYEEAEHAYRLGMGLEAENPDLLNNLGILCRLRRRPEEARRLHAKALALQPLSWRTRNNLGVANVDLGKLQEAEGDFRAALDGAPDNLEARINLADCLEQLGRVDEAEHEYQHVIADQPGHPVAYLNLGLLLIKHRKDFGEAERLYRAGLGAAPCDASLEWNLSLLLLRLGHYEEGWRLHAARRGVVPALINVPSLRFPEWHGEPLSGKRILVWGEQGHGDEIQFARYAPLLRQLGASRVDVVCKGPLRALFESLDGIDHVFAMHEAATLPDYDFWTMQLDIPHYLRTTIGTIPASLPYLSAPDRIARWRRRLPDARFRIGLVWKGNPEFKADASRSLPSLRCLAPLWRHQNVAFVSLQKGAGEDEARVPPHDQPLTALGPDIEDFADTAAIVSQLDLVISSCTSMAHLVGAVGRPCWVMLGYDADWRWLEGRTDSPWYPDVMRLFRQSRPGNWESVVDEIAVALTRLAGQQ